MPAQRFSSISYSSRTGNDGGRSVWCLGFGREVDWGGLRLKSLDLARKQPIWRAMKQFGGRAHRFRAERDGVEHGIRKGRDGRAKRRLLADSELGDDCEK